jgi:serine/threonine protein kinase
MLTGRLPFEAETAAAAALERLHRQPAPPSSVNSDVPRVLDGIVLRCLSRHPRDRFQSADEVLAALDSLSEWQSQNIPPSAVSAQAPSVRSSPWARIAVAVVLAGVSGVGVWSLRHRTTTAQVASANAAVAPPVQTTEPQHEPEPSSLVAPPSASAEPEVPAPIRRERVAARQPATRAVAPAAPPARAVASAERPAPSASPHTLGFAPPPASSTGQPTPQKKPDWENPFQY